MKNQMSIKQTIREVVKSETSCKVRLSNIATLVKEIGVNFYGEQINKLLITLDYIDGVPITRYELKTYKIPGFNPDSNEHIDLLIEDITNVYKRYLIQCVETFSNNMLNGHNIMPFNIQYYESEV